MRRMSSCARSGALGYYVYSTQSSHGTWLFPPNANQGGNSQPDAQSDAERPAPLPAFFVSVEVFLLQLKPRGALGFLSFCSGGRNGTVASASLGHSATRGRQSPFREAQEMADARLYHYCRDGAWSGRCMGGSGVARRDSGARTRGHVVKGHVARSAQRPAAHRDRVTLRAPALGILTPPVGLHPRSSTNRSVVSDAWS